MATKILLATISAIVLLNVYIVDSAKILSVAFISSKSHKIVYEPLLRELANRNHEITILSPVKETKKFKNIREILVLGCDLSEALKKYANVFELKKSGVELSAFQSHTLMVPVCETAFDTPEIESLLTETFDLIIIEAYENECVLGLVHKLNTSFIIVSPLTAPSWITLPLGAISPPSFVPSVSSGFTDQMTFYQRLGNFAYEISLNLFKKYYVQPIMAEIYRRKLNDSGIPLPSEVLKNASLVLSNTHFSIGSPQPLLPDVIEVNGMHIRGANPLSPDLEQFVYNSSEGFVLFSMGSVMTGSKMPERERKIFIKTFSNLKQNVLWKWESETMPDLPPNVKLSKWLPQQDLLGHPRIKAFITHGGLGSTSEAVYYGVPIVGIPMFSDQLLNIQRSEAKGFAIHLQYRNLTEKHLAEALDKVIHEPKYKENAMKLSKIFRDQPDKPLDRAVFWVEYVLRHKGATHLRSPARDLNFFQYYSLDVIGFFFVFIVIVLYTTFAIAKLIKEKLKKLAMEGIQLKYKTN